MKRSVFLLIGISCVILGIIGVILPVMPGTIFFILAAYFFGRSSEKLEAWLLSHPKYGPSIVNWRLYKSMSRAAKKAALTGMLVGFIFLMISPAGLIGKSCGTLFILSCAIYVYTRPEPPQ
ncbi:MAG: YbaN family protein [Bdellovibrionaceae bacterium]|nr:YbaN family protein [Pseudobdellovibrionaceae bacterium]